VGDSTSDYAVTAVKRLKEAPEASEMLRSVLCRASLIVLMAFAGLVLAREASADALVSDQVLWCLTPGNRAQVVSIAALLDLGRPAGPGHTLIIPNGSKKKLRLDTWRKERPKDFSLACGRAYGLFSDQAISKAEEAETQAEITSLNNSVQSLKPGGLSKEAETEISVGGGVLAALVGGFAGYLVTKRSREDDRDYEEASALGNELILLSVDLDLLAQKARAGDASGDDYLRVRSRAQQLLSKIPASAKRDEAVMSLRSLVKALDSEQEFDPDHEAIRLEQAGKRVVDTVGAVIVDLHKKAVPPPGLMNTNNSPDAAA
jgi:hypothetical protein